jgi:hypothetical protein
LEQAIHFAMHVLPQALPLQHFRQQNASAATAGVMVSNAANATHTTRRNIYPPVPRGISVKHFKQARCGVSDTDPRYPKRKWQAAARSAKSFAWTFGCGGCEADATSRRLAFKKTYLKAHDGEAAPADLLVQIVRTAPP